MRLIPVLALLLSFVPRLFGEDGRASDDDASALDAHVIIVGAGAAGLNAGRTLRKSTFEWGSTRDFLILEASDALGGRTRKDTAFVDFPIDLGASWMGNKAVIRKVRALAGSDVIFEKEDYRSKESNRPSSYYPSIDFSGLGTMRHFKDYTWYDFIADHIAPDPSTRDDDILYGCQVIQMELEDVRGVRTTCADGRIFNSSFAIVTVPLQFLKDGAIDFEPPPHKKTILEHPATLWSGFKVFVEFSDHFYPEKPFCFRDFDGAGECDGKFGENLFWDVSLYHKNTTHKNVLAVAVIGPIANPYIHMDDEDIVRNVVLSRLDNVFDGKATKSYMRHKVMNWNKDPYTRFTYTEMWYSREEAWGVNSHRDKVFFAGEAFHDNHMSGWVHSALNSGKKAADLVLELLNHEEDGKKDDNSEQPGSNQGLPETCNSARDVDLETCKPAFQTTTKGFFNIGTDGNHSDGLGNLWVAPNPVPEVPPPGYFNYDFHDKDHGPDSWRYVDTEDHPLWEFEMDGYGTYQGHLKNRPTWNRCGYLDHTQSPIDLTETTHCRAIHEIRSKCAHPESRYARLILPHKLSLDMNRRPCRDFRDYEREECDHGHPPMVDLPKYTARISPFSDLLNFDIKVPGEHSMEGESFDAEIQMMHTHFRDDRLAMIAIPIRATVDGHNEEFQVILDQFQLGYDRDAALCARSTLSLKRAASKFHNQLMNVKEGDHGSEWEHEYSTHLDDPDFIERLVQIPPRLNPYSKAFMRTIWFYRYDGTLTEPPCTPVNWWVMDKPMIISFDQLYQMKVLLFTHIDGDCHKTSVHNSNQSVARPQDPRTGDQKVEKCDWRHFVSDVERGQIESN